MIKTLKLTKFRKHEDRTFEFGEGLVVCRGANESGKTTIQEGMLYALYGAKVLRDSLSQCVTWGHKEGELKVELVLEVEGQEFSYRRSKAGAEVIKGGNVFVTGQSEVTAFSATLLGADAKTAGSLMLADQSGLRGALDEGPSAVSGLMSKLADFDTIDRIILAMQETLLLGADGPIRERLKAAEVELEQAFDAMPAPFTLVDAERAVSKAEAKAKALRKQRDENEAPAYSLAIEKLRDAEAAKERHDDAVTAVNKAQTKLGHAVTLLDDAKSRVVGIDHDRIATLRKDVFDSVEAMKKASAWEAFNKMPGFPAAHWEGDSESFHTYLQNSKKLLDDANAKTTTINNQIADVKRRKIEGGVCKVCGTDISQRKDIVENNAAIDREVAVLTEQLCEWQDKVRALSNEVGQLEAVSRSSRSYTVPPSVRPYVTEENLTVPTRYLWIGGDGYIRPDIDKLKEELADLERKAEASNRAEGEVKALERALEQARIEYADVAARLQVTPDIDLAPFKAAHVAAADALNLIDNKVYDADKAVTQARADHEALLAQQQSCLARLNMAKLRIDEYTKDIEAVGFNNALLKKIRAIKPLVTDHLWGLTLASVSTFFTTLRKEASVVTKTADGFLVNGSPSKSLSGSTLDILSIAVRVALTKVFLPNMDMLILDEPAHGADRDRTASILGFLSSIGYRQVIIATHDEISEAVATQTFALEAK